MHMLGIGSGDRHADLFGEIQVNIEIGTDQFHQLDVLKIDHVGAVAALNQGSFQLLFQAFHGISEHDLFQFPLFDWYGP